MRLPPAAMIWYSKVEHSYLNYVAPGYQKCGGQDRGAFTETMKTKQASRRQGHGMPLYKLHTQCSVQATPLTAGTRAVSGRVLVSETRPFKTENDRQDCSELICSNLFGQNSSTTSPSERHPNPVLSLLVLCSVLCRKENVERCKDRLALPIEGPNVLY